MLSYQILNYYEFLKDELEKLGEVLEPLWGWTEKYEAYITRMSVKILKSSVSTQGTNKIYTVSNGRIKEEYIESVKEFKKTFLSYTVFDAFGQFKQKVIEYRKHNKIFYQDYILTFIKETEKLFETYQLFQQDDTEQEKLINFGNKLIAYKFLYTNSKLMYSDLVLLETNKINDIEDDQTSIKIQLLDVEYSVKEFSDNLQYFDDIYNEIGNLIYSDTTSISYEKLKIIKIESGSLFSEMSGNKKIIDTFTIIIKKAVRWVQNKYESGEEIERHTKLADALKNDVEILELLEKNGCNVNDSKTILEKAFNKVAKDALEIATSTAKIKINEEEYNVNFNGNRKYLTKGNMKMLDCKKDE